MKHVDHIINSKNYPVWFILAAIFCAGITGVFHQGAPFAPYSEIRIEQTYQENANKKVLQFYQPLTSRKNPDYRKLYCFRIAEYNQSEHLRLDNIDSKSLEIFDFKLQESLRVASKNIPPHIS